MDNRIDKQNYYLDMAEAALNRGTCLRRNYGAIIVNNDSIVSTGYTGAPRGRKNCCDLKECIREKLNVPRGERYELCRSVHAEQNAIISASRKDTIGATMYMVGKDAKTNEYDAKNYDSYDWYCITKLINSIIISNMSRLYRIAFISRNHLEKLENQDYQFF